MLLLGLIYSSRMTRYFFQKHRVKGIGLMLPLTEDQFMDFVSNYDIPHVKMPHFYNDKDYRYYKGYCPPHEHGGTMHYNQSFVRGGTSIAIEMQIGETYGYDAFIPFKD